MSTRTTIQHICDRSGRFIEPREAPRNVDPKAPDLFLSVPWIPALGDLIEADDGGARGDDAWRSEQALEEGPHREPRAIFDDLSNKDRLTVAKILARLLKIDEAKLVAAAIARDGHPLTQALELEAWGEVTS